MSDRIAETDAETSHEASAPPRNTASPVPNCLDANEIVRTAYFPVGPAADGLPLSGRRLGAAKASPPSGSFSLMLSKGTVATRALPGAVFLPPPIPLGNRVAS